MATIAQQLTQLNIDKANLVDYLVKRGIEATNDETFTSLVAKLPEIQNGDEKYKPRFIRFIGCGLSELNDEISNLDTSNITNMNGMFQNSSKLTSLDLSSFNTSKVTDMGNMFIYCNSLTSLDLSSFDTSKVTNMINMFSYCNSLTSLDLRNASFNKSAYKHGAFNNVPATCEIIVKDQTAKDFILSCRSDFTNIKLVSEVA